MLQRMLATVVSGLGLLAVASCSHDSTPHAAVPAVSPASADDTMTVEQPVLAAIPVLDAVQGLTLPIEPYLLTKADVHQILQANGILIHRCMGGFGFDYTPPLSTPAPGTESTDGANMARRYGVTDPQAAAAYGYHDPTTSQDAQTTSSPPLSEGERLVLYGNTPGVGFEKAPQVYDGRGVPEHGCSGEAQRQTGDGLDEKTAEKIDDLTFQRSQKDPRVQTAFHAWSQCMAGRGYRVPEPEDVLKLASPQSRPSAEEIETAKADVDCKKQNDVIGTWFAVETAMQRTLIGKNEEALTAMKREAERTLRNSTAVIAQGS